MIKLEVGKRYMNRTGDLFTISSLDHNGPHKGFPFVAYRDEGVYYFSEEGCLELDWSPGDLIEEVLPLALENWYAGPTRDELAARFWMAERFTMRDLSEGRDITVCFEAAERFIAEAKRRSSQ